MSDESPEQADQPPPDDELQRALDRRTATRQQDLEAQAEVYRILKEMMTKKLPGSSKKTLERRTGWTRQHLRRIEKGGDWAEFK